MGVTPSNATSKAAFSTSAPMQPADRPASRGPVHRVRVSSCVTGGGLDFERLRADPSPKRERTERSTRARREGATRSRGDRAPRVLSSHAGCRRHGSRSGRNPNEATVSTEAPNRSSLRRLARLVTRQVPSAATSAPEDRSARLPSAQLHARCSGRSPLVSGFRKSR
jgi:hypothetical protein